MGQIKIKTLADGSVSLNLSDDSDYHTQLNNKLVPYSSCNTTSIAMALDDLKICPPVPEGVQSEDYLTELTEQDKWYDYMLAMYGTKAPESAPRFYFDILTKVTNEWLGYEACRFNYQASFNQVIWELISGRPVVVIGAFTKSGHIVKVAGFRYAVPAIPTSMDTIDRSKVTAFEVDDPYGNYFTGYTDQKGNDVVFERDALWSLLYGSDYKPCLFFSKPA